jgi:hypothetical protein
MPGTKSQPRLLRILLQSLIRLQSPSHQVFIRLLELQKGKWVILAMFLPQDLCHQKKGRMVLFHSPLSLPLLWMRSSFRRPLLQKATVSFK